MVKFKIYSDGTKVDKPVWCAIVDSPQALHALCTGEIFGEGEDAVYELKEGDTITCTNCMSLLKELKKYKW